MTFISDARFTFSIVASAIRASEMNICLKLNAGKWSVTLVREAAGPEPCFVMRSGNLSLRFYGARDQAWFESQLDSRFRLVLPGCARKLPSPVAQECCKPALPASVGRQTVHLDQATIGI